MLTSAFKLCALSLESDYTCISCTVDINIEIEEEEMSRPRIMTNRSWKL